MTEQNGHANFEDVEDRAARASAALVDLIADEATITAAREISDKLWDTLGTALQDSKLSRMNLGLHVLDQAVQRSLPHAHLQMGIVFMVAVMCFRRILSENSITDRGHRMKILRATAVEFEKKLRQYATANG